MHMVAARLGFEKAMVGTRRATPRSDCMDRPRKHYSHLAEGWFLARKAAWSLSGCMATDSTDYYMLVNEWVWSKSRALVLREQKGWDRGRWVGQGEVGGVTGRVLCTWWLLGLALKRPWLVPGGQPHALTAWTGLENTTLTLQRAGFWQERLLGL